MVRKKLGQHFLCNLQVAAREVAYAEIHPDDVVLEIGPGTGILTRLLAQQAKKIIAVEIDAALVKQLSSTIPANVHLIHADILDIDFMTLPRFTKIVANLPFQISSPLTFHLLEYPFSKAVLMYQKDFAERMVAQPGTKEYSRLSVGIYYKTHCQILEVVSASCFSPRPQVDACIVELVPRVQPPFPVADETFFFELTKKLFLHRRKKIKTIVKDVLDPSLDRVPYGDQRVEELSPKQIGELSTILLPFSKK